MLTILHLCAYSLQMAIVGSRVASELRIVKMIHSSWLPPEDVRVKIGSRGIEHVNDKIITGGKRAYIKMKSIFCFFLLKTFSFSSEKDNHHNH
jgi:hypothetical protein